MKWGVESRVELKGPEVERVGEEERTNVFSLVLRIPHRRRIQRRAIAGFRVVHAKETNPKTGTAHTDFVEFIDILNFV